MTRLRTLTKHWMLLSLTSAWMTGAGLRFLLMKPHEVYTYSVFDKFFDWGIMFLLGIILFTYTIYGYFKEKMSHEKMVD